MMRRVVRVYVLFSRLCNVRIFRVVYKCIGWMHRGRGMRTHPQLLFVLVIE
jgi:hypothetical protein